MITTKQNPKIQRVRKLMEKAGERRAAGLYVIEGVRLVEDAAVRRIPVETVFFDDNLSPRGMEVVDALAASGAEAVEVSQIVLASLSDTETPQGLMAVVHIPHPSLPEDPNFLLVLDTIRDPGNLGTILRTAAAAGVQAALLSPACADAYSPKVVRAGMGAHFCFPILRASNWPELRQMLVNPVTGVALPVVASGAFSGVNLWDADFRQPLAIMVSNEAMGTSLEATGLASTSVSIPMPGNFESLNAAIAAGIMLFEVIRQRNYSPEVRSADKP
jgi:TrmH family RNA methyltransferase